MADAKITALGAMTTPISTDILPIVDDPGGTPVTQKVTVSNLARAMWVFLDAALTSTSWDGDARSTEAKTLIDLSAVFAVPAGVKAVLAKATIRDSGSAATATCGVRFAPNSTAGSYPFAVFCGGLTNDSYATGTGIVPCNSDGDIYYQTTASGAGTLDVTLEIWGYMV